MILLTGATGFLGKKILSKLLVDKDIRIISLVIRATSQAHARERIIEILEEKFSAGEISELLGKIHLLPGDVTEDKLGLTENDYLQASKSLSTIYHCAASTALNQSKTCAEKINIQGTKQVIELARCAAQEGRRISLHHVSTAYVAGDTDGVVTPEALNLKGSFRNHYEYSKALSEKLVRDVSTEINTRIYRPSIIIGDSNTGHTSAFNVLYVPAKFIVKGLFHALPAIPHTPFDVVPVNYVADAILKLSELNAPSGKCYHLSAGLGRETSPKEILECIITALELYKHRNYLGVRKLTFLTPEMLSLLSSSLNLALQGVINFERFYAKRLDIFKQTLPFLPYMMRNPQFDTSATITDLDGKLSLPPLFTQYADKIFGFCLETNWGKLPIKQARLSAV
ncbi:MAG: SDR family oxidoreductase [Deltaproteobacteria bacterium]|nr:SDR family oxidoreductase [Deltaproteobacteria bacterium]